MQALDVKSLARLAHKHGALCAIDNSWASPIFQQPIKLGVDIVVHTASKYLGRLLEARFLFTTSFLGGHSDVVAGVVASSKSLCEKFRNQARLYIGGKLSPFDAWLLIRGLRTLPIRIKTIGESALFIAKNLAKHPMVEKVYHPGLGELPEGLIGMFKVFDNLKTNFRYNWFIFIPFQRKRQHPNLCRCSKNFQDWSFLGWP